MKIIGQTELIMGWTRVNISPLLCLKLLIIIRLNFCCHCTSPYRLNWAVF